MAAVKWNPEGLDSLVQHDAWRLSHGWEPVTAELIEAIEAYFRPKMPEQPPRFMPGRPAILTLTGAQTDLRMVTVEVRSKDFRVYFCYRPGIQSFEILQVLHPRTRYDDDQRQS